MNAEYKGLAVAQLIASCINIAGGNKHYGKTSAPVIPEDLKDGRFRLALDSDFIIATYVVDQDGLVSLENPAQAYVDIMDSNGWSKDEMEEDFGTINDFIDEETNIKPDDFIERLFDSFDKTCKAYITCCKSLV